jgi:hypothetical protein
MLYVRQDTKLKEDVSKQILTMLSTILAAMIGFYFGARPGESDPDAVKRAQSLAAIERVMATAPKADRLVARIDALTAGKLAAPDKEADRKALAAAKARIGELQKVIDEAAQARLSAATTAVQMSNSAAAAESAAKDLGAIQTTIEGYESEAAKPGG